MATLKVYASACKKKEKKKKTETEAKVQWKKDLWIVQLVAGCRVSRRWKILKKVLPFSLRIMNDSCFVHPSVVRSMKRSRV